MKRLVVLTGVTFLLLALPGRVPAQTIDKSPDLNAGGKTIGGPGVFRGASPDHVTLLSSSDSLNVCVTLINVGSASVTLLFDSNNLAQHLVASGTTQTACKGSTETISAVCGGAAACKYLWRVDLY